MALIDSVVIRFPLSSSARGLCVRAKNGVAFGQFGAKYRHWYASFELSRFTAEGIYTPPVKGLMPYEQNNINVPTCKGAAAAKNRIYDGCVDTLFGGDAAFDLPLDLIPTPGELLYYISHGIGCGNRCLIVAAKQGICFYSKRAQTWTFEKRNPDGTRERIKDTKPYFL